MSLYTFDRNDAYRFAQFMGISTRERGDELIFEYCPYCQGQTRKKEKFSINLDKGVFNCFRASCGKHGNMIDLADFFDFSLNEDVDRFLKRGDWANRYKPLAGKKPVVVKDEAVKYLTHRGISEDIVRKYEVTVNDRGNLCFPFRDTTGNIWFIKYRNMHFKKGEDGSKEWCSANTKPILFGMNHCEDFTRLVITEGQCDSLACATAGIKNATSVPMGACNKNWIPHCYSWIQKFNEIVVFGDCEHGHITLVEMVQNYFENKKISVVREEDYQGCKDANDLLILHGKQAVIDAVENAEPILNKAVIDFSTIKPVDFNKVEKIKTGFPKLDGLIGGGFMVGQTILLSGERGKGKSTLASQFVVEALSQNANSFIYSGELSNEQVKTWLNSQLYGTSDLDEKQKRQCDRYYVGRCFGINDMTLSGRELLPIIKDTVIKKNIKFIVIDNLMSALTGDDSEKLYHRQSEFVGELVRMSKAMDLVVILIAHPRKGNGVFRNDDVSGSGDITNRVDIVMSYDVDPDREEVSELRMLRITKNRFVGKLGSFELWYEEKSKRISQYSTDFSRDYLDFGFVPENIEIPF